MVRDCGGDCDCADCKDPRGRAYRRDANVTYKKYGNGSWFYFMEVITTDRTTHRKLQKAAGEGQERLQGQVVQELRSMLAERATVPPSAAGAQPSPPKASA